MTTAGCITVSVGSDRSVVAEPSRGRGSESRRLSSDPVDELLVDVFQRWIGERENGWRRDELQALGAVLHRTLFPSDVWSFVETELGGLGPGQHLRLRLSFPASDPELAAVPWEYLHTPGAKGGFLATDDRVVLTRYVHNGRGIVPTREVSRLRVLLVVSQPRDLPDVVPEPVQAAVRALGEESWVEVHEPEGATAQAVADAVAEHQPHVLHFVGHGTYDEREDIGKLAFENLNRSARLLTGKELTQLFGPSMPCVALLQSCHGATPGGRIPFRATAQQLVREGVDCVVAMRHTVTPEAAAAFAVASLRRIADGADPEVAFQAARAHLAGPLSAEPDLRMIGVPVIYTNRCDAAIRRTRGGVP